MQINSLNKCNENKNIAYKGKIISSKLVNDAISLNRQKVAANNFKDVLRFCKAIDGIYNYSSSCDTFGLINSVKFSNKNQGVYLIKKMNNNDKSKANFIVLDFCKNADTISENSSNLLIKMGETAINKFTKNYQNKNLAKYIMSNIDNLDKILSEEGKKVVKYDPTAYKNSSLAVDFHLIKEIYKKTQDKTLSNAELKQYKMQLNSLVERFVTLEKSETIFKKDSLDFSYRFKESNSYNYINKLLQNINVNSNEDNVSTINQIIKNILNDKLNKIEKFLN